MAKEKSKLDNLIADLSKDYGEGCVMRMTDTSNDIKTFPSGSLSLDVALGGGFARGKVIELYSEFGCGKSGRALQAVAEIQSLGREVLYLDHENALNLEYAKRLGVDVDKLFMAQPGTAEESFSIAKKFIESGEVGLIVFDSTNSMTPKAEMEGESGQSFMGVAARLFSQAMKQLVGIASKNDCTLLFISQMREKIGSYIPMKAIGVGKAVAFYATQRLELKRSNIGKGDDITGFTQKIKVTKNKVAPPFKIAEIEIDYKNGVDINKELLTVATSLGITERKGAWYNYGEVKLGQGADKSSAILADNPELCDEILVKIKEKLAS